MKIHLLSLGLFETIRKFLIDRHRRKFENADRDVDHAKKVADLDRDLIANAREKAALFREIGCSDIEIKQAVLAPLVGAGFRSLDEPRSNKGPDRTRVSGTRGRRSSAPRVITGP